MCHRKRILLTFFVVTLAIESPSVAQRVRLSNSTHLPTSGASGQFGQAPALTQNVVTPQSGGVTTRMTPISPTQTTFQAGTQGGGFQPVYTPQNQHLQGNTFGGVQGGSLSPSASLQTPAFDPFATQPAIGQPPVIAAPQGNFGQYPANTLPQVYPPAGAQPYVVPQHGYGGNPNYAGQPNSLFPGWQPNGISWPYGQTGQGQYLRLFEDLRMEGTWVNGDGGADVDMIDALVGVTMNYPDFLRSGQPLRLKPVFVFHFWDGPGPPVVLSDLPSRAYSTYLQLEWETRQDVQFGGEIDFAIGVYSDFQSVTMDSIRLTGTGLGWLRVTPNVTVKAGVEYFDRLDIKLLPAGGIFWNPHDDLRLEIYFPRPRIARRLPQLGNTDIWFYAGGEYGGGSWVIERADLSSDQVDINDFRVFAGFEWQTLTGFEGFVDIGFVFNRELVYRNTLLHNLDLQDTFMLRAGFAY